MKIPAHSKRNTSSSINEAASKKNIINQFKRLRNLIAEDNSLYQKAIINKYEESEVNNIRLRLNEYKLISEILLQQMLT